MNKKIMTICSVYNDTHILLGEILKEGKLKGMFNGFGGKLELGESIEKAAIRELQEEAGIIALDLERRGVLTFEMDDDGNPFEDKSVVETHIFSVTKFEGEPAETNEMRPQWFLHGEIPYDLMWPDDKHWMPLLLEGKNFIGKFILKDLKTIKSFELMEADNL